MIFDPAAKQFTRAPEALQSVAAGVSWHGFFLAGGKAYRMPDLAEVDPPFPIPPAEGGGWSVDGALSDPEWLVLRHQAAVFRHLGRIVVGAEAAIEAAIDAIGDAALAREEGVAHARMP